MTFRISETPAADRPRERLFAARPVRVDDDRAPGDSHRYRHERQVGARTWRPRCWRPEVDLARLARRTAAELAAAPGVGPAKAARIAAGLELGRRLLEEGRPERTRIRSPADVYRWFAPRLADLAAEEFHVLALDSQSGVLRDLLVTRGILNSSLVHPREVFRGAIAEAAAGIIVVHNHPSGDPTPSADDRAVTRQLVEAGRVLDLPVYDHVVVGANRYLSFAEAGLL